MSIKTEVKEAHTNISALVKQLGSVTSALCFALSGCEIYLWMYPIPIPEAAADLYTAGGFAAAGYVVRLLRTTQEDPKNEAC